MLGQAVPAGPEAPARGLDMCRQDMLPSAYFSGLLERQGLELQADGRAGASLLCWPQTVSGKCCSV